MRKFLSVKRNLNSFSYSIALMSLPLTLNSLGFILIQRIGLVSYDCSLKVMHTFLHPQFLWNSGNILKCIIVFSYNLSSFSIPCSSLYCAQDRKVFISIHGHSLSLLYSFHSSFTQFQHLLYSTSTFCLHSYLIKTLH